MIQNSASPFGIHWFRRDLRIDGNPALRENWKRTQGNTVGVFFFDQNFLSRPDFSHRRFAFFIDSLIDLRQDLRKRGSDLWVFDQNPQQAWREWFAHLSQKGMRPLMSFCRDYEPFAQQRDRDVLALCEKMGITSITERDHLVFEPHEIVKPNDKKPYQIYTPFAKRWFEKLNSEEGLNRIHQSEVARPPSKKDIPTPFSWKKNGTPAPVLLPQYWPSPTEDSPNEDSPNDLLMEWKKTNLKQVDIPIPKAGHGAALETLKAFEDKLADYLQYRDSPHLESTSQLSIYFKNGSLTSAQALKRLDLFATPFQEKSGRSQWKKEIAWREFYYSILYHFPRVETESFNPAFSKISWENREDFFKLWCEGKTGFPIVDAGMRQLQQTGWMHNRVRMIVASFLTKDLLIDWRWGERFFMKQLLDGDLAPNNGGWQWSASTGCDPQPYFRIFNPWLQSERFDPQGDYIRRWVPELRKIETGALHDPKKDRNFSGYPHPVVDHARQKLKALQLFSH